ncbi:transferase [Diaporthe sp. PMI_573]|nr:transferase [Diaporthaceae sp. PMI_573]
MASPKSATLSPLDHLMPPCYIRVFLIFESKNHDDGIGHLAQGLSKLAKHVPYIKGRVFKADDSDRCAIKWSDEDPDPKFQEIALGADSTIPSYGELNKSHAPLHHFCDSLAPLAVIQTTREAPVFATSYTKLDGALLVCICVHHNVMDGGGAAELAGLWAACARGETPGIHEVDPEEPLNRRSRLQTAGEVGSWSEVDGSTSSDARNIAPAPQPPPARANAVKIFRFSAEKLVETREALRRRGAVSTTTQSVLSAVIWSNITRIRLARIGQAAVEGAETPFPTSSRLTFPVNGRTHLGEDFSGSRFLGNVTVNAVAEVSTPELGVSSKDACMYRAEEDSESLLGSLGRTVDAIDAATKRVTKSHITDIALRVDRAAKVADVALEWQIAHELDLTMTSWANQGYYGLDFGAGLGAPKFVRVPYMEADGLVIILPRTRESSGERIEVLLALNIYDFKALENDRAWKSWLSA